MKNASSNNSATFQGRGAERVKLRGRAHLVQNSDPEHLPLEVELEDLSFQGAGMISTVAVQVGTAVVLLLQSAVHSPRSIRGHVLNCRAIENGHFRIGLEFDVTDGPTINSIRHAFFPDDALNDCV